LGRVTDETVREYYQNAKAFIFPGEEDFGITPLEAQACGCPVIAYKKGGALETVIEGETGIFFGRQQAEDLCDAVRRFESMSFDSGKIRANAENFAESIFTEKFSDFIKNVMK